MIRWRVRVVARTRPFEWVTTRLNYTVEIAGFAADAVQVFELIVVRFQFTIGNAPILARVILRDLVLAIAFYGTATPLEIPRQETESCSSPMHACTTHAFAGLERWNQAAHGQRRLIYVVAERDGLS